MKYEYIIVGDNNEWFSTCTRLADAKDEMKRLSEDDDVKEKCSTLYLYKGEEIDRVDLEEED